jgi:molybdopterin synthase sulfur carrier subunit
MKYTINLFGITRDIIGGTSLEIAIEGTVSVHQLLDKLKGDYPKLQAVKSLLVAVNSEYATDDLVISTRDEIALIPPVSGG